MSAKEEAMDTTQSTQSGADAAPEIEVLPDDPEVLREQIEETRHDLGETVEALAAKMDVKEQAKEKLEAGKEQFREQGPLKPALAAIGAFLLLVLRRKRRNAKKAKQS